MFTVRSEVALIPPELATIWVYPAPTAVANPAALMVATEGLPAAQVTELLMLDVVGEPDPIWLEPNAWNCAVWPTAVKTTAPCAGRIEMEFSALQPASRAAAGSASSESKNDAGRARESWESPAPKLLSPQGRRPCHV